MKNFEKFDKRNIKTDTPKIRIYKANVIYLNIATMFKYVKNYKYAIFLFNKKDLLIGIQLTNTISPETYTIRKYRAGRLGYLAAISFLKFYNIEHNKTFSYIPRWNEKNKMLIIDLKQNKDLFSQ